MECDIDGDHATVALYDAPSVVPHSRSVKLAIIGCGHIVRGVHLPLLRRWPGVELVAAVDADARQWPAGIPGFTDYREALALPGLDAVLIAAPNAQHAPIARAALEAGKHVYLEKPLATNLAEAEPVITAWRRAGVVGMIGFNYRFNPLFVNLRQRIRAGRLGEIRHVRSAFTTPARPLPAWKQARATGGGVLLDLGSHHFDLLPWLLGRPVERVAAEIRSVNTEADTATVRWQFAGGITGESHFSLAADRDEDRIEIGPLVLDRYRSRRASGKFPAIPGWYTLQRLRSPGHEPSYRRALTEFITAIRTRRPASPDLADGYRSLQLVCEAETSP